jgi:hypothetical protein
MKKVLVIFDGERKPSSALDFALSMNNKSPILLTGVFLPSIVFVNFSNFTYYGQTVPPYYMDEYNESSNLIKKNMVYFRTFCEAHNIRYLIHEDIKENIIDTLRDESRFADLMILSSNNFHNDLQKDKNNEYREGTFHKSECPVILLPELYTLPNSLVIAYDGSAYSVHAIKQFIYLLPHLTDIDTHVVFIGDGKHEIPFLNLIKEYAPQHFSKIDFNNVRIKMGSYMRTREDRKETVMVITGALGRNMLSELFHKTFMRALIQNTAVPIFIAHK